MTLYLKTTQLFEQSLVWEHFSWSFAKTFILSFFISDRRNNMMWWSGQLVDVRHHRLALLLLLVIITMALLKRGGGVRFMRVNCLLATADVILVDYLSGLAVLLLPFSVRLFLWPPLLLLLLCIHGCFCTANNSKRISTMRSGTKCLNLPDEAEGSFAGINLPGCCDAVTCH